MVENSNNTERHVVQIVFLFLICLPTYQFSLWIYFWDESISVCNSFSSFFSVTAYCPTLAGWPYAVSNTVEWPWLFYVILVWMIIGWVPGDRALPGHGVFLLAGLCRHHWPFSSQLGLVAVILVQRSQKAPTSPAPPRDAVTALALALPASC